MVYAVLDYHWKAKSERAKRKRGTLPDLNVDIDELDVSVNKIELLENLKGASMSKFTIKIPLSMVSPDLIEEISQYISDNSSENDKDLVDLYVEIYDVDLGIQVESKSSASIRACNELLAILDAYSQEPEEDEEDEISEEETEDEENTKISEDKKTKSEKIYYSIN